MQGNDSSRLRKKMGASDSRRTPVLLELQGAWPDDRRGIPAFLLRTPIGGPLQRGRRVTILEPITLATLRPVTATWTGSQVDAPVLDVYLHLLHCARHKTIPLGVPHAVKPYSILKGLDLNIGSSEYKQLRTALKVLASVEMQDLRLGALPPQPSGEPVWLLRYSWPEETGATLTVTLPLWLQELATNPDFRLHGSWTWLDWEARKALRGQQLAQWLHGYFSSHADPFPISVARLRELCGSSLADKLKGGSGRLSTFRESLRIALDALALQVGWLGIIEDGTDVITLEKQPSARTLDEFRQAAKARQSRRELKNIKHQLRKKSKKKGAEPATAFTEVAEVKISERRRQALG